MKIWWGETTGENFRWWGKVSKFAGGGGTSPIYILLLQKYIDIKLVLLYQHKITQDGIFQSIQ